MPKHTPETLRAFIAKLERRKNDLARERNELAMKELGLEEQINGRRRQLKRLENDVKPDGKLEEDDND